MEQENFKVKDTSFIKSFKLSDSNEFTLTESFHITLDDNSNIAVVFHEGKIIKSLYIDSKFYSDIGQKFCISYDACTLKQETNWLLSLSMVFLAIKKWTVVSH